jgi:hypothetical protein
MVVVIKTRRMYCSHNCRDATIIAVINVSSALESTRKNVLTSDNDNGSLAAGVMILIDIDYRFSRFVYVARSFFSTCFTAMARQYPNANHSFAIPVGMDPVSPERYANPSPTMVCKNSTSIIMLEQGV